MTKLLLISNDDKAEILLKFRELMPDIDIDYQSANGANIDGYDFVMDVTQLQDVVKSFSKYLVKDENVGFYYGDFFKETVPIYHTKFPSYVKSYPVIIFPSNKLAEAVQSKEGSIVDYLGKRYISKHIPELICKV